jgi:selenocysteine-specific elongation factor
MKQRASGDAETLLALVRANGLRGVHESRMTTALPLSPSEMEALAQNLEAEGVVRILSFSPLFVVSRESVDFFRGKIVAAVARHHEAHPEDSGILVERLRKRFDVPTRVFLLAMKALLHEGVLRQEGDGLALKDFVRRLPPRDERLLERLETGWDEIGRPILSQGEIQERLAVRPPTLAKLIKVLIDRRRILAFGEGLFVRAGWLDGIIAKVRDMKRTELTVSDFKTITGLSRKYAIPLLELLDDQGITRRRGASRDIVAA